MRLFCFSFLLVITTVLLIEEGSVPLGCQWLKAAPRATVAQCTINWHLLEIKIELTLVMDTWHIFKTCIVKQTHFVTKKTLKLDYY